jgi:SAM-dependent methyltransferase
MNDHQPTEGHEHRVDVRDDHAGAERFWENHYRRHEQVWSGNANAVLVAVVAQLSPGIALDLGCGEGGDAIWLARQGWRVTAVDVSPTALQRVADRAAAEGVAERITCEQHDLAHTFPVGRFHLVSAHYLHTQLDFPRAQVLRAGAGAVAVGGLLLIVEHASIAPWSWNQDPQTRFPTPEATLHSLELDQEKWQVERLAAPPRQATGPGGQIATVIDNIIAIRRLADG